MTYQADRQFSDTMLPALNDAAKELVYRNRLANLTFTEAPVEIDQNDGIDMFCEMESKIVFAYRVSRNNRINFFLSDFTVRYTNQREGSLSEWEKMLSGRYASYMLAGIQHEDVLDQLQRVILIDVNAMREQVLSNPALKAQIESMKKENGSEPGKFFLPIPYKIFTPSIIIDQMYNHEGVWGDEFEFILREMDSSL